jgi:hypothetical protein
MLQPLLACFHNRAAPLTVLGPPRSAQALIGAMCFVDASKIVKVSLALRASFEHVRDGLPTFKRAIRTLATSPKRHTADFACHLWTWFSGSAVASVRAQTLM